MALYESSDSPFWEEALEQYASRVEGLGKERLVELDEFYRIELVRILKERGDPAYITKDELVRIVDWKLTRGKWRPRLLGYAKDAEEANIVEISKRAFAALPNVQEAIKILSELKGIGPATASAVLAASRPDLAPFMSDEALAAALQGTKDYTPKKYAELAEALTKKAKELGSKSTGEPWTPSDVERAIWSDEAKSRQKAAAKSCTKTAPKRSAGKTEDTKNSRVKSNKESAAAEEEETRSDLIATDVAEGDQKRKKGSGSQGGRNVRRRK